MSEQPRTRPPPRRGTDHPPPGRLAAGRAGAVGRAPAPAAIDLDDLAATIAARGPGRPTAVEFPAGRHSAVLVALFPGDRGAEVVLTRRSQTPAPTIEGEISFPGGRLDPGETPVQAALREAHEEVALDPGARHRGRRARPHRHHGQPQPDRAGRGHADRRGPSCGRRPARSTASSPPRWSTSSTPRSTGRSGGAARRSTAPSTSSSSTTRRCGARPAASSSSCCRSPRAWPSDPRRRRHAAAVGAGRHRLRVRQLPGRRRPAVDAGADAVHRPRRRHLRGAPRPAPARGGRRLLRHHPDRHRRGAGLDLVRPHRLGLRRGRGRLLGGPRRPGPGRGHARPSRRWSSGAAASCGWWRCACRCCAGNVASQRVAERAGFAASGIDRADGDELLAFVRRLDE